VIFTASKQYALVLTLVCLWLSEYLSQESLEWIGYVAIASLGILHGSNDLQILGAISRDIPAIQKFRYYHLAYAGASVLILAVFYLFPSASLYFFIGISAYHFGEQHYEYTRGRPFWRVPLYFGYGLLIFSMLFYNQFDAVDPIISEISGQGIPKNYYLWAIYISGGVMLVSWAGSYAHLRGQYSVLLLDLFILALRFLVFREVSLIWGFSLYFILWHSLPSLRHQIRFLSGESNWKNFLAYLGGAWLYWLMAIVGGAVMWFVGSRYIEHLLTILVYFLAAITFPHVLVMSFVHRKVSESDSSGVPEDQ
jgi:Brp/Blh family beta-carotene 15,15'-monooxygenase